MVYFFFYNIKLNSILIQDKKLLIDLTLSYFDKFRVPSMSGQMVPP